MDARHVKPRPPGPCPCPAPCLHPCPNHDDQQRDAAATAAATATAAVTATTTTTASAEYPPPNGGAPPMPLDASAEDTLPAHHHMSSDTLHVPNEPPFWSTHGRTISTVSYHSVLTRQLSPIRLEDHSEEHHEATQACWAQSVTIDDYSVVSGPTGIGAYVVWHCSVGTLKGGALDVRKRFSDFDQLRADLVRSFPLAEAMIPALPRKSVVSRFRPKFLEQRRAGLEHFLNCILLNPEFAASPVLKDFIFS